MLWELAHVEFLRGKWSTVVGEMMCDQKCVREMSSPLKG